MTAALMSWLGVAPADRAERRLWRNAPTVGHVGELMAWFCLGELQSWPGHAGPTDPETREANLGPVLAAANRRGFLTLCSQPGVDLDDEGWQQRAAVDGLATPAVLAQLRGLVTGTRLQVIAHPASRWRRDYAASADVTRVGEHEVTRFGGQSPASEIRFMFDGVPDSVVDELVAMWQVAIVDLRWGAESLLWDRLAEPDWDHPVPPTPEQRRPVEPPVGAVLETRDGDDVYRIEHLPDGWAIQYRPGEDEGATHTTGRISWRAAWSAWGPPTSGSPLLPVLAGAPPLPSQPEEPPLDIDHPDASGSLLHRPPAAQPHRPRVAATPYTPSLTTSGVTVNSSIQEIRGILTAASDVIGAAQGPIQHAIDEATRARNALMAAMDGSYQPDVEAQVAVLTNMIEHLEEALGRSHHAIAGNQAIGARL